MKSKPQTNMNELPSSHHSISLFRHGGLIIGLLVALSLLIVFSNVDLRSQIPAESINEKAIVKSDEKQPAAVDAAKTLLLDPLFVQQGGKLVGTGFVGAQPQQGEVVALSADGNTAIVGASFDNNFNGAAWVWTRSGGVWTQQGGKLSGSGAVGTQTQQAKAVALSADGNTAIIGGYNDNSGQGAVWVFTRSGGVWTQQGAKLVGSGAVGNARQGISVSLSADGNTAIVGGQADNSNQGAVWVWTRSGSVWSQQGTKLVGSGAAGAARQGWRVSLSADGNTALAGGNGDNVGVGAVWVWTRSGSAWTQQGGKLIGSGGVPPSNQGDAIALSADGNTAVIGGYPDDSNVGAVWIFTRTGGVWSQQGAKLIGSGAVGAAAQGIGVAISGDGNTVIVGGPNDNGNSGTFWVWLRGGGVWTQQGTKRSVTGAAGVPQLGFSAALSSDGTTAIVGGTSDNNGIGAAWVFYSPPPEISVSGRVLTSGGRGIRGATVTVTGPGGFVRNVRTGNFGAYTVTGLTSGNTYSITGQSRRFTFASPSLVITPSSNITNADFVGSS